MDEQLLSLIKKYNQGTCTPEEKELLESWYHAASLNNTAIKPPAAGWEETRKIIWANVHAQRPKQQRRIRLLSWQSAAAAVLVLFTITGLYRIWQMQQPQWTEIRTTAGEIRQVILPDSSSVIMNGNAVLRYASSWNKIKEREVWITGEAFFDVKHLHRKGTPVTDPERFLVHAGVMQLAVLGTSFNVNTRTGMNSVVLETGRVQLSSETGRFQPVVMQPGEMLTVSGANETVKKEKINTRIYTAWKTGKLELDKTNFGDVVKFIGYNYGRKIGIRDTLLLNRQLSGGTVDTNDEQQLYTILSTILKINIRQQGDSLIISHQ
ncbi:FecR family protein [Chitinophaga sp. RAB17]|uniref:FecR family protein n=1 Tax=Chitinophaga sp. RAB17 TaxID=3233049 RepID=UPI003F90814E